MANPPTGSGTDIASLSLNVETNADTAAASLDNFGTATVRSVKNVNDLSSAVEKNAEFMARANAQYQNQIQVLRAAWEAEQQVLQAEREVQKVRQASVDETTKFIAKLEEMVATFGMSKTELLSYRAAQLGVQDQTRALIAELERLNATQQTSHRSHQTLAGSADNLGISFNNNRARTELLVLAHEALQGRFTRMPGSLMVLAEYTNAASLVMSVMGATIIVVTLALAGLAYEMAKGQAQSKEFNDSINRTNNYADETRGNLELLAHSVGALHGSYKQAYEAAAELTMSGRFTAEQIGMITESVVGLEHAFGTKLNVSIKEFESLTVKGTASASAGSLQVSKALEKLDEQYHFVNASLMEEVLQLEKEGKAREASALAVKAWADETKRSADKAEEYIGSIERAWNAVTKEVKTLVQYMADIGKISTPAQDVVRLKKSLENPDMLPGVHNKASRDEAVANVLSQLADAQRRLNEENQKAAVEADKGKVNSEAAHVLVLRAIEDKKLMKKASTELQDALARNAEENKLIEAAHPGYIEQNRAYLNDRELAIIKAHTEKTRAIKNDGRKSVLADSLAADKAEYDQAKESADQTEKMLKEWADSGQITRQTEYNSIAAARKDQLLALDQMKRDELDTLAKYKPLNDADAKATIKRTNDVTRSYELAAQKIKDATELTQQQIIDKSVKAATKDEDAEIKSLDKKIEKQKLLNAEIGKTAAQKDEAIKAIEDEKNSQDELRLILLDIKFKTEDLGAVEQATTSAEIDKLTEIVRKRKEYNAELALGVTLNEQAAIQKALDQEFNRFYRKLNDDLASAIVDGGGRGVKKLIRDMEIAFAKVILEPILQPISQGITSLLYPNASAATGVGGAAGSGGVGGAIGLANAATNAYKMLSGGFSGIGTGVADTVQGMMYQSGMTTQIASNGAFATGAGTAASAAAGLIGGHYVGNAISGGYGIGDHGQAVVNTGAAVGAVIGSIIPVLGTALGAVIGGALGGLANRLFGMGSKDVTSMGLRGTLTESGVTGEDYSNWHQNGGLFRSDKNGTDTNPIATDVVNSFKSAFGQMKSVSVDFAKTLGVGSDALKDYSKTFDIVLTQDQAANEKLIGEFFTTVGDDIANKLIPNLAEFARNGESASATLQRLNDAFIATNAIADMIGKSAEQAFGSAGLSSDAARERIIDLAGSIQNLNAITSSYNKNYLTDAEKLAPAQKAVAAAMKEMGYESVTTKLQFKNIVDGLKLTNAADAALFINLMKIQDAFAQVADATDKVTQAEKDLVAARNSDLLSKAMSNVDVSFARLSKSVAAEKDRLNIAYDLETKAIKANADALKVDANVRMKAAQDNLGVASKMFDTISNSLKSMAIDSVSNEASRRREAQALLRGAVGTRDLSNATGIQDALATVSKPSQQLFQTFIDYARDQARTINTVVTLKDIAQDQKDYAQLTVDGITAEIALIDKTSQAQLDAAAIQHAEDLAKQDKILEQAQIQIDTLNKIDNTLLTVRDALGLFAGSLAGVTAQQAANSVGGGTTGNVTGIESLYQSLLGRHSDPEGLKFWQAALGNGLSLSEISAGFTSSNEYKGLHPFADGTNYVPQDMDAHIHEGEAIIPKADNRALMSAVQGNNNGALIAESKALRQEVAGLRAESQAENIAIQRDIGELARLARRWEGNGIPVRTDIDNPIHTVTP